VGVGPSRAGPGSATESDTDVDADADTDADADADADPPPPPPPPVRNDDPALYDALFDVGRVHTVSLTFDAVSWDLLLADGTDWVEADWLAEGDVVAHVGVRLTGDLAADGWQGKAPLEVGFDVFVPGTTFGGLDRVRLANQENDPTGIREVLALDFLRNSGVVAPRAALAELVIDGDSKGLYTLVEPVDAEFVARHWADVGGDLWEGTGGCDFSPDGLPEWSLARGDGTSEATLAALTDAVLLSGDALVAEAEPLLDVDGFLGLWAHLALVGHMGSWPYDLSDAWLYVDPLDGRIDIVPWDIDQGWDPDAWWNGSESLLGLRCTWDTPCDDLLRDHLVAALVTWDGADMNAVASALWEVADPVALADDDRSFSPEEVMAARGVLAGQLAGWSARVRAQAGL
jgi:hypothetical protein